jgi:tRNA1(Val) A37 N6-methylase TrmN6
MATNPPATGTPTPNTTDDTLLNGTVMFRQPATGYRAAIDPILLAAAVPDTVTGKVLDLGCGAGAAMLCLAKRRGDISVVGLERDPATAELARHNAAANHFDKRATVLTGDFLRPPPQLVVGSFDAVIVNPPYLEADAADPSPHPAKKAATVEGEADLTDWARAAARFAKPQGLVIFIHRADRLPDLHRALTEVGFGGAVTTPLWPKMGTAPKRAIVAAQRGSKEPSKSGNGLVLHEADGTYTRQATSILRDGVKLAAV